MIAVTIGEAKLHGLSKKLILNTILINFISENQGYSVLEELLETLIRTHE